MRTSFDDVFPSPLTSASAAPFPAEGTLGALALAVFVVVVLAAAAATAVNPVVVAAAHRRVVLVACCSRRLRAAAAAPGPAACRSAAPARLPPWLVTAGEAGKADRGPVPVPCCSATRFPRSRPWNTQVEKSRTMQQRAEYYDSNNTNLLPLRLEIGSVPAADSGARPSIWPSWLGGGGGPFLREVLTLPQTVLDPHSGNIPGAQPPVVTATQTKRL